MYCLIAEFMGKFRSEWKVQVCCFGFYLLYIKYEMLVNVEFEVISMHIKLSTHNNIMIMISVHYGVLHEAKVNGLLYC